MKRRSFLGLLGAERPSDLLFMGLMLMPLVIGMIILVRIANV